ncbi:hypothetical protein [Hyunsoonleella ulvae]|uniref:hypothetical protein n=2 Tax=Flavobacteriaceae TaxID=49546 RepID=UPI00193AC876|nr:hypothetical protein [Hyunsoonleella ulvae]
MKFISFLVLIFLAVFNIYGQESAWCYIDASSSKDFSVPKQVFQGVDERSGDLSFIINNKDATKFYLYGKGRILISEFTLSSFLNKAENFIGGFYSNSIHVLFFKNKTNSLFDRVEVNYNTKSVNTSKIELNLKKDYVIETFKAENSIFILSIRKNSSILKLYKIRLDGNVEEKTIDLSHESFKKFNGFETTLYYLITNKQNLSKIQSASIKYNVPTSIETTSAVNKIYFNNGIISLTNDNTPNETNIIQIDIKKGNYTYFQISKRGFLKEELRSESNSFILDSLYFSNYVTTDKLVFAVYDLNQKTLVKEFEVNDDDTFSFKNTPVIIASGKKIKDKDSKNSNFFLRQLTNSNVGVSAYKHDKYTIVSLGGSIKEQSGTLAFIGGVFGGLTGAMLLSAFDSYSNTKSTKVDCLFDKNFNHVEGEIPVNGFDKLNKFIKENNLRKVPLQILFEYKDNYVWGYHNKGTGMYNLYKFKK